MTPNPPDPIIGTDALDHPWGSVGPFIVAGHHIDAYPRGNGALGPHHPPTDHDRWSMYHGSDVPGFLR